MAESLKEACERLDKDCSEVFDYVNEIYDKEFKSYFDIPDQLYKKLKSNKITDDELSQVMIDLPLDLMQISEILSNHKLHKEVVKLQSKKLKIDITHIDKKSDEYLETQYQDINNSLVEIAEDTIIEMVEKKITMCKELIMGAKKIWDARRHTEEMNPISEVDDKKDELPDYDIKEDL